MIYGTGDTHTPIDIKKLNSKNFPEEKTMTKNDYVIIMGDFGLWWKNNTDKTEIYWTDWLNNKNFTTLFVDGNHENHFRLLSGMTAPEIIEANLSLPRYKEYTIEEKFGGYVGRISDSIYHLRRGEIYIIEGKKFFVMGGAYSIDKINRIEGISWWKEEEPNNKEIYYGLDNLKNHNNQVDYILGHTAPGSILEQIYPGVNEKYDYTSRFFDHIRTLVRYDQFYCGHWHEDIDYHKYHFLFRRVIPIV